MLALCKTEDDMSREFEHFNMSLASIMDAETSGSVGMTLAVTFLGPPSPKKAQLAMEALKIMFHLPHIFHT